MECGTVSSVRDENGVEILADAGLLRLALPCRVFTLFPVLRFFTGRLAPIGDWAERLVAKFKGDFGNSL